MLNYVCTFHIWSEKEIRMSYKALTSLEVHFANDWMAQPIIFNHNDVTLFAGSRGKIGNWCWLVELNDSVI